MMRSVPSQTLNATPVSGGKRKKRRIHSSQMSHSAPLKYLKRVYIVLKTRKYVRAEDNNWIHTQVGRSHVQCALGLDGR